MKLLSFSYEDLTNLKLKDFFLRLYTKAFEEEDVTSNAAQVAFYFAFALFPLLLFLLTLFGFMLESADDLRAEMFFYLRRVMPGSAFELVQNTLQEVSESSSGGKLTFGILAALWAASAGIDSTRIVLNGVYNLPETRPYWKTKLISLLMTLGLGILVTVALSIVFYGSKFVAVILNSVNLPIQSPFILGILQWAIVLVVLASIFALLYNFLPNHKTFKWVWVSPGAILSIILWLLLSYGFGLYLDYFNTYAKTYGSLGAMIILMLWLYLTALVILIGGSINAVLQELTDPATAEAGANKTAAKEIVENPDKPIEEASKEKDKILESVSVAETRNKIQTGETRSIEKIAAAPEKPNAVPAVVSVRKMETISDKPALNLLVGSVFGVLFGLFFSRRKRDD
ncbi:MAG: YihY/virulence factor BrkB family protein [Pyrinomonadaceae bacterium]|nr:YihY/virulence factor BrkB family protein [Pyrinomonadaceae bacterium]